LKKFYLYWKLQSGDLGPCPSW